MGSAEVTFGRVISRRGGRDRPCWYEGLLKEIDAYVQAFEPVSAEEYKVAWLGEDDNGRCGASGGVQDGEADFTLENAAVSGLKAIDALWTNREGFK